MTPFDPDRAFLSDPDRFQRFRVPATGRRLKAAGLAGNQPIIVFERDGVQRALLLEQMAYHHCAQGELAGEPYLVSF